MRFVVAEWAVVLGEKKRGVFASPFLEPASIVARETGDALQECFGCGQFREGVRPVEYEGAGIDVCVDCRRVTE